jgi:hypothetical protein
MNKTKASISCQTYTTLMGVSRLDFSIIDVGHSGIYDHWQVTRQEQREELEEEEKEICQ